MIFALQRRVPWCHMEMCLLSFSHHRWHIFDTCTSKDIKQLVFSFLLETQVDRDNTILGAHLFTKAHYSICMPLTGLHSLF